MVGQCNLLRESWWKSGTVRVSGAYCCGALYFVDPFVIKILYHHKKVPYEICEDRSGSDPFPVDSNRSLSILGGR